MPRSARAFPVLLVVLASLLVGVAHAEQSGSDLLRSLSEHLAAGRYTEALTTARRCSEVLPGSAAVWYNLAGLEEKHGDRATAVAALRQAVVLGFDDFRYADDDPDLGELRHDQGYRELREAWAAGLAARVQARQIEPTVGEWSDTIDLDDRRGGLDPPTASARLRVSGDHLDVEIMAELRPVGLRPPWRGGTGLLMAVLLPEDPTTGEGRLVAEFGVGMADGLPVGAVRLGDRWQRLAELTPKLRRDPDSGRLRVTFAIPWTVCGSLHPLVDKELGVNLTWIRSDDDGDRGQAAWIADPASGRADRIWRRGILVRTRWTAAAALTVSGRIADRVVRHGAIEVDPLAVATGVGTATPAAEIVLRGHDGILRVQESRSLNGQGAVRRDRVLLETPPVPGSARIGVTVGAATWETSVVILPERWEEATAARIARAPGREQPSLQYRLDAVISALAHRLPRHDPTAIGATVDELERLLTDLDARGTSLPAGGVYLAVAPAAEGGRDLRCSLALPGGWQRGDPARVVLLLARAPGQEQQAAMMAPRLLAERTAAGKPSAPLVVAVAHLGPVHEAEKARRDGAHLVDWLRDFVAVDSVHLAGVDLLAATALELAAARPDAVAATLLITGMNFTPYSDLAAGALPAILSDLPATMPVGWIWFPDEQQPGDQAAMLRQALDARGTILDPARPVAGGLDFSQAWSRAVVWASEPGS